MKILSLPCAALIHNFTSFIDVFLYLFFCCFCFRRLLLNRCDDNLYMYTWKIGCVFCLPFKLTIMIIIYVLYSLLMENWFSTITCILWWFFWAMEGSYIYYITLATAIPTQITKENILFFKSIQNNNFTGKHMIIYINKT